jgi:hypothetical protein
MMKQPTLLDFSDQIFLKIRRDECPARVLFLVTYYDGKKQLRRHRSETKVAIIDRLFSDKRWQADMLASMVHNVFNDYVRKVQE